MFVNMIQPKAMVYRFATIIQYDISLTVGESISASESNIK